MWLTSIYNDNLIINLNDLKKALEQNNNIDEFLNTTLKHKIGDTCNKDGLIRKSSINIINRNNGAFLLDYNLLYKIQYKADILFPNEGCILEKCKIIYIGDAFYLAQKIEINVIIYIPKVFINQDGNKALKIKYYYNILCIDKFYQVNDKYMYIIGKPISNAVKNIDINIDKNSEESIINECKQLWNTHDLHSEYYDLFNIHKEEEDIMAIDEYDTLLKTYNINENNLEYLKNLIITDLSNKNLLDYINISDYTTLDELMSIIHVLNAYYILDKFNNYTSTNKLHSTSLYETSKNKTYDQEDYNENEEGIINPNIYCYMISVFQSLKSCKIFLLNLKEYIKDDTISNYSLLEELYKILNNEKNILDDFIKLFNTYLLDNPDIEFNHSNVNDAGEFFNILLRILDNNNYNPVTYNIYPINIKEYTEDQIPIVNTKTKHGQQPIKNIINEIIDTSQNSLSRFFYNIRVEKLECLHCKFIKHTFVKDYFVYNSVMDLYSTSQFIEQNSQSEDIKDYKCEICKKNNVTMSRYIYIPPLNYCMFNLKRSLIQNSFHMSEKNRNNIIINDYIFLQHIDIENSFETLLFKTIRIDIKSFICHYGTNTNNGHYITLNKQRYGSHYKIYNDKYTKEIPNSDLEQYYKDNYLFIYQENSIYDIPFSNLSLLDFEYKFYEDSDSVTELINTINYAEHIKNKGKAGYKLYGGSNQSQDWMDEIMVFNLKLQNITELNKILDIFYTFFNEEDKPVQYNKEQLLFEYLGNNEKYFTRENKYIQFYKAYLIFIKQQLIPPIELNLSFLNRTQENDILNVIHVGSSSYDVINMSEEHNEPLNERDYWDMFFWQQLNHGDYENYVENPYIMYEKHFNTIEINAFYYHDFTLEAIENIHTKIKESNIRLSIVFNKNIPELLHTNEEISVEKINTIFSDFIDKINIKTKLSDHIDNIVFKFDKSLECQEINIEKIKILCNIINELLDTLKINIILEFNNSSWYNNSEFIEFINKNYNNIALPYIFMDNTEDKLQYSLTSKCNVNYIKLYGSKSKYYGSHEEDLPEVIKNIKNYNYEDYNSKNITKPIENSLYKKPQYIYFNNIEGDFTNKRYNEINEEEEYKMPQSLYEAKLLCKILESIN